MYFFLWIKTKTIKIKDLLPEVLLDLWEEDFSIARGIGEKKMAGTFKLGDVAEVFGLFILVTPENIEYCNTPININNYSTWIEKTIKDIKKILEEKIIINKKINLNIKVINSNNFGFYIAKAIKLYSKYLVKNNFNLAIVLGDRFETYAFALACY